MPDTYKKNDRHKVVTYEKKPKNLDFFLSLKYKKRTNDSR